MVDKSKIRKKGFITEEDASALLGRYSADQVLALLQEVSQVAGEKFDWHEMVKNTATGISNAREYQILWRHLAYGGTLPDQIDHDQNPMDDDSDLDYEMEAYPPVGRVATSEAAACAKVLIASGHTNGSDLSNSLTIEAPLTISMPNSEPLLAPSDSALLPNARQGTNFTIPVSLQRVPSSGTLGEKRPANEATRVNVPPKRKRGWSAKDDLKLTAAANKNVEPNWADIARMEFNNERNANDLSQRWENLKKKQGTIKVGAKSTNVQRPDQLAAAHRAMSIALDRPKSDNFKAASVPFAPDSMVKAAAVAAGARGASSACASSLMEAARSQNDVHITTSINSQLPKNVHFIRNGLAKAPISTYFAAKAADQSNSAAPTPVQNDAVVSTLEMPRNAENDPVVLPSSEAADNGENTVTRNAQAM